MSLLMLSLAGCERADPVYNSRFLAFGTLVDLSLVGLGKERAHQVSQAIEADFQQMHEMWHAWDPGPLGRVNELCRTGERFAAPPSVLLLIKRGQQLSAQSGGRFNPAIGDLIAAWGFHRQDPTEPMRPPPPERIAELVQRNPQMSDILLEDIYLQCRNPAVKLDFGAFGKGYGIDLAVRHLRELGVNNAIVKGGGDLRAIGSRSGTPWRIAIRRPSGAGVLGTLDVAGDESVFTSGNYERTYQYEGRKVHHIIDPRTGYPAEGTASVTVLHSEGIVADAAATALFIAGPEHWYEVAKAMGIGYVVLVDDQGALHMNPEMQARLQLLDDDAPIRLSPPLRAPGDQR